MDGNGEAQKRLPSALDATIPPDFNFVMPSGEVIRGRVWMVTAPQVVTPGHTFSANWAMDETGKARGHKLRWVLVEDLA